ncbi:type I-E CRISPR-associated protein Cas6/Cse3/CasE [Vibrio barjaei]|nr:type I-E CRISPR-associated protein Cas6/Cse3/CasE [Vibrio barjaei]
MYVTRVQMHKRTQIQKGISDTYGFHKFVYSMFKDVRSDEQKRTGHKSGIIWVDKGLRNLERTLLIVSDREPVVDGGQFEGVEVSTRDLPNGYLGFERYQFNLTVNPVIKEFGTGKYLPVIGEGEIKQWLVSKSEEHWGFKLVDDEFAVVRNFPDKFQTGHKIVINKALITGRLEVVDQDKFAAAFQNGIGRAKTYGCGLLELTPEM